MSFREDIEKCLNVDDKIIIVNKKYNGNPYGIWNLLLENAKYECNYF